MKLRSTDSIKRPAKPVKHRDDEYDQSSFYSLRLMQENHFWYRGRHRFLLASLDRFLPASAPPLTCVDLGGGVGGWVKYLFDHRPTCFAELALADSSLTALDMAASLMSPNISRYQVDLMNLDWEKAWDIAFLLDVIEHLPNDDHAMRNAARILKPGGLLFVTTPALKQFWSYNDVLVNHQRRYSVEDYAQLAQHSGLELLDARYFMFLLSPLYWLFRQRSGVLEMTAEQQRTFLKNSHRVPHRLINFSLAAVFAAETPLGHWVRFPWGTSILGIFRKL
ncbi:Methyltransferase domain family protein [Luminiphilus syltensis NOR5-1B]|uniref:Methyltransferase domain family protein n=1 Tax=Luminiphilus syltensis NOR5-1B TaxID=565045 RepID=B8KR36_9GAMM|nr:class I SAM-dependent methyltransferase [Luminiphilus syltensis]EED34786.1 Methyltransferase domain family protein [Luminiphilus syltensis NOR5-1B]